MKKEPTEFVKRMQEIDKLNQPKLFWPSSQLGTYVKSANGKRVNKPNIQKRRRLSK